MYVYLRVKRSVLVHHFKILSCVPTFKLQLNLKTSYTSTSAPGKNDKL